MTAAPIPALAHDHDLPTGRGGMSLTPPSSAAAKRFSVGPSRGLPLDPPSQIASNMPDHADHAGRLPRSTERPALKSP